MLDNHSRKELQDLMSDVRWRAFDTFFDEFMRANFTQGSCKRDTEWDTIWQLASNEGGRYFLNEFKNQLEVEARQYKSQ